jgi:hypothetical protein
MIVMSGGDLVLVFAAGFCARSWAWLLVGRYAREFGAVLRPAKGRALTGAPTRVPFPGR